jgi:hypothetical protein
MIHGHLSLGSRPQPFFKKKSIKAGLSIAKSGYVLLSRVFSSSRVFVSAHRTHSTPRIWPSTYKGGGCDTHFRANNLGIYARFMFLKDL